MLALAASLVLGCGARSGLDIDVFDAGPRDARAASAVDASAPPTDAPRELCTRWPAADLAVDTLDGPHVGAGPGTPTLLAYTIPGDVPHVEGAFFDARRGTLGPRFAISEGRLRAITSRASASMLLLVDRPDGGREILDLDIEGRVVARSDARSVVALAVDFATDTLTTLGAEGIGTRWAMPDEGVAGELEGEPLSIAVDSELVILTRAAERVLEHRGPLFGFERGAATRALLPERAWSFAGALRGGAGLATAAPGRAIVSFVLAR